MFASSEWKSSGKCSEASSLNDALGEEYFSVCEPHFFTGNLDADIVLVHLNPKRNKGAGWANVCKYDKFDDYFSHYAYFGRKHYGVESARVHKSPFDYKQIRFLEPFKILPFNDDKYHNLEIVVDQKLQLELVPYGSPNFDYKKIGVEKLKPFIETLLDTIAKKERKYVIFCGRVFEQILSAYIKEASTISQKLKKVNGEDTKNEYQIINIKLVFQSKEIVACIAPQFAQQGCPLSEYGKFIAEFYGKF